MQRKECVIRLNNDGINNSGHIEIMGTHLGDCLRNLIQGKKVSLIYALRLTFGDGRIEKVASILSGNSCTEIREAGTRAWDQP
jgi:hypothetical protein